jgi:tetratricopeptide (TPR) repeat protein
MKRIIAVGIMLMSVLLTLSLHGAFAQNEISEEAAIAESNNYVTQGYSLQGQEAIDLYDKAIQIYPQNFYAYYNKGTTLIQLERYREAVEALNMALSIIVIRINFYNFYYLIQTSRSNNLHNFCILRICKKIL